MNTKFLIAFATATAAITGSQVVLAQEVTPDTWINGAQSTPTRTEVSAKFLAARPNGEVRLARAGHIEPSPSKLDRETVRAETLAAMRNGEIAWINTNTEVPDWVVRPTVKNAPTLLAQKKQ